MLSSQSKTKTKGYLVVASTKYRFYSFAINLLESIKDYNPDANVCLVTEERFLDSRADIADHVILCDDSQRAKLWGMANSPYDLTFYIDADCEVMHEDISKIWDELGDNDMMFTGLPKDRWYVFKDTKVNGDEDMKYCGAVCLYDSSNPIIKEFMMDWYDQWTKQQDTTWWPLNEHGQHDYDNFPESLRPWDQFSLWWLTNRVEKYSHLKVGIFENDLKWNYWAILDRNKHPMPEDTVIFHLSCQANKFDDGKDDSLTPEWRKRSKKEPNG